MKLSEIQIKIEKRIPLVWAEEWDNPGLSVGDPSSEILRIAVALDFTEDNVNQAILNNCQMLFTHHPAIFRPIKSVILYKPTPKAIALALKSNIAVYSAHTNWDSSSEGVNFCLANSIGLTNIEPLLVPTLKTGAWGLGAVGILVTELDMKDCLRLLKRHWQLSTCIGYGDVSRKIKKIAVGGGACGNMWQDALKASADVFITSDVSYDQRQDSLAMGLNLIITDHGEMERVSLPTLAKIIEQETSLPVIILEESEVKQITI